MPVSALRTMPQPHPASSGMSHGSLREFFIHRLDNLFNLVGCPILLNQAIWYAESFMRSLERPWNYPVGRLTSWVSSSGKWAVWMLYLRNTDSELYRGRPPDKCFLITKLFLASSLLNLGCICLRTDSVRDGGPKRVWVYPCVFLYICMCVLQVCMCSYIYRMEARGQCWISFSVILYLVYCDRPSQGTISSLIQLEWWTS